jgi:hypothetical protein
MKAKTTLILLLVTGLLFAYLFFYDKNQPSTGEAKRRSENVVNISPDKVDGIVIQNGDEKIELRRTNNKWRLESPIKDQADSSLIDTILSETESWQKDATISTKEMDADKNKLSEYGLNKPKLRLKLNGPEMPPEILFGKEAALENKMYARFENSKETYVVSQKLKKAIDKKPDDFRDKKLTDLNTTQVARLILKSNAGEMELEKKNDHWNLVRPLRARGDDQKINDLIAQVTTARIQQFVADDRGDLHPYGLAEPRGAITLFGESDKATGRPDSSRGDQGQMLQIGAVPENQKDQVYARFASRGFVYTLPKKVEDVLNVRPNDLRDRHLVRVDRNNLDRLTIDSAGKGKVVLSRKDDLWTIASSNRMPASASEVRRLIDTLSDELVTKFVEDVASNLPKYGLDKPALQVTFSSFASENTAETKAGEQPFATVAFGKIDGDNVYARLGDEPFILAVRRSLLDNIFTDPLQWQDLAIFNFKPEEIHRITLTTDKEQALMRGPNNVWQWSKGEGAVNQTNVQSLLNTLARLHAVRWVGATVPAHGFDKPQLVLGFTTSVDDKAAHKLTVGGSAGNGMWFARVDGRDGTFLLSNPDLNALKLPLTQTAAPSLSVSPAASASRPVTTSPVAAPTP